MKNSYLFNDNVCTLVCHSKYFGDVKFMFDKEDYNRVSCHLWRPVKERKGCNNFRAMSEIQGIYMHRLIMSFPDKSIDHINRDPSDNRKENLRICTHQQNCHNRINRNKNLPKGVYHGRNGQFRSRIWVNNKNINLGCNFKSIEEASEAFKKASKNLHKEFSIY